ncbi:MAG: hypothetical protein OK404_02780, partial [Thaumarchaeota archaeon]|nr:hypothetical protein [Nitrososphaerota archaeon]
PPANSASLTLHYQQPNYWAMPYGAQYAKSGYGGTGVATIASQPTGVPTQANQTAPSQGVQYYVPNQIPPLQAQSIPRQDSGSQSTTGWGLSPTAIAGSAVVFGALAIVVLAVAKSRRPPEAAV